MPSPAMQRKNGVPSPIFLSFFFFYFTFLSSTRICYTHYPLPEMINYRIAFEIFKEPVVFREPCYLSSFSPASSSHTTPFRCRCYLHRIILHGERNSANVLARESHPKYSLKQVWYPHHSFSWDTVIINGVNTSFSTAFEIDFNIQMDDINTVYYNNCNSHLNYFEEKSFFIEHMQ